jgi:NADH dehydrogenase [ubiquinone] 1 alpha subcomplex assembly factor 1
MMYHLLMNAALASVANLGMEIDSWGSVNDGVMGGLSAGGMVQSSEGLSFKGTLSLENNGGFSSVRRLVSQDLSTATAVRIEVRGDGREYQFRIRQDNGFDGVAWRAVFTSSAEWQQIEIPFDEFIPVFRGRQVPQAGPVVPSAIRQIGFLVADKKAGEFELDIRRIEFIGTGDTVTHD